ncbi:LacI family DNA-binding transcriptional regulator [Sinomonas sp. JGH33]|uniref:LacI family DNA-binding transcriptional regulator n=1 Tax=Sinomonas terricola TaxID=3110330 RepID=A0ABU5T103_9MICC|nr:LacI family DNA-binding transcriptional regulator [Sinomonas sp. JGH33]MEA5453337.1 LacI family DNA-binding transcriptional regulator [Sinomonas sp. JGH33]
MSSSPIPPAAQRPSTIYQVARLAGVSHQTVSRYLKGNGGLKPQTVAKVEDAMARLDYTPNLAARALRSKQSYRIIVVAPEDLHFAASRILGSAVSTADEAGYVTEVVHIGVSGSESWDRLLSLVSTERLAGIFSLIPLGPLVEQITSKHPDVPLVVAGNYDEKMHARGSLADATPAAEMIEHLASLGHRSFYHVAGPKLWTSAVNRSKTYETTVARLGLHSAGSAVGDWSMLSGYRAGLEIPLADGPVTAVFAANDHMALGVMRALHERGKRVPEDVSVFGWDNLEEGKYFIPSLSTVSMDLEASGRNGMRELISRIRNEPSSPHGYEFTPMQLIFRESTAEAPTRAS